MSADKTVNGKPGIPRLRADLEYIAVSHEGRRSLLIRDPLELAPQPLLIQGEALGLLGLIDGRRSLLDIQVDLVRQRDGLFVSVEDIAGMVGELETAAVLETPQIEARRRRLIGDFVALKVRPAFHAGRSYPSDRKELESLVDRILDSEDVPSPEPPAGPARALVAPHIDLEAGRRAYARAYGSLRGLQPPRRILLLGTGHSLGASFFSMTAKDFETPLGRVRTDKSEVRRLISASGPLAAPDDFSHRSEHSLEFQLIFLQRLFGSDFTLLPILCGSFQDELPRRRRAADIPGVEAVLGLLADFSARAGSETLIVAGVDLSHVGPKFGHDRSATALQEETGRHDRRLIEALLGRDPLALWEEIRSVGDRFNVCGFSTLACLLEILAAGRLTGRLLDYDLRQEAATRSAVSFAAMVFYAEERSAGTGEKG
ncbi:MAG: AmmeMemoRadiSam system protein B [Candidatus Aminicenantes bacterium RBG_13_59_9]|nr:MAG: AmmeMemoRadiSam system protein B [Candidatus Aminicenantes bacterium RBG_13_59_9]